jgi:hypothetical protein
MKTVFEAISKSWECLVYKIMPEYKVLLDQFDKSNAIIKRIDDRFSDEMGKLERDLAFHKSMLATIGNTIPDMMWAKDLNGKYIYANKHIKDGLLFDPYPEGKTDIELAMAAKIRFGCDNHTFGEVCGNSDIEVITHPSERRFLESGKVKGKMLYLEVFKAPLYLDGKLVGTCGTGRDMTEYVEAFYAHNCGGCNKMNDIFAKYRFEG